MDAVRCPAVPRAKGRRHGRPPTSTAMGSQPTATATIHDPTPRGGRTNPAASSIPDFPPVCLAARVNIPTRSCVYVNRSTVLRN